MIEEEEQFQWSNSCWVFEKLIDNEKVRDHCHITGKFSAVTNFQLTKKVPVIFHDLKGYNLHLIFYELKRNWCKNWCNTK